MTDSLPGPAVREVEEETGLDIEVTGLVGTYTDPRHVIAYCEGGSAPTVQRVLPSPRRRRVPDDLE